MQKCQEGDIKLFWKIYDKYVDKLYHFVYLKTTNREISEDIISDVFMSALKNIDNFSINDNSSVKSWLYRIANNKVIDFYRTNKDEDTLEEYMDKWFEEDLSKKIDDKEKINSILEFLKSFKKEHRDVFIYRIWYDMSYNEVSEVTWLSVDNCKKIVSRTIKNISINFILILFFIFML